MTALKLAQESLISAGGIGTSLGTPKAYEDYLRVSEVAAQVATAEALTIIAEAVKQGNVTIEM